MIQRERLSDPSLLHDDHRYAVDEPPPLIESSRISVDSITKQLPGVWDDNHRLLVQELASECRGRRAYLLPLPGDPVERLCNDRICRDKTSTSVRCKRHRKFRRSRVVSVVAAQQCYEVARIRKDLFHSATRLRGRRTGSRQGSPKGLMAGPPLTHWRQSRRARSRWPRHLHSHRRAA